MPDEKRVILCIMDGWGVAPEGAGNAITQAAPATFEALRQNFPSSLLEASGIGVGLPVDEDGNSETGHLNIGAGRIVYQDLPRINMSIADGSFFTNPALISAVEQVKKNDSSLHLLGLIGRSGVHAYNDHLYGLLLLAAKYKLKRVYLHLITDGRDSPPKDALSLIDEVETEIKRFGEGKIVSLMGRYYAMDRDMRLDRTQLAFDCLMGRDGAECVTSAKMAIERSYVAGISDEFIRPVMVGESGAECSKSRVKEGDALIFYNFRVDRPRQLSYLFIHSQIKDLYFVTMTKYHKSFDVPSAFEENKLEGTLSEVVSTAGKRQLHAAESEKERFVSYYFNGQREETFAGEDRLIVPSPKVATYDFKPEMSTVELVEAFAKKFAGGEYALGVINIACPDMVAHTSNMERTKEAILATDRALDRLKDLADKLDAYLVVTADHGNAEELIDPQTDEPDTKHSTYPVPFIIYNKNNGNFKLQNGVLADVAPTILSLLDLSKSKEMTGHNLIVVSNGDNHVKGEPVAGARQAAEEISAT